MEKINENLVKTDNFGVVWKKDYENPRFSFLKRDKGVPAEYKREFKRAKDTVTDAFGKRKTIEKDIEKKYLGVSDEYFEWKKLHYARIYAQNINSKFDEYDTDQINSYYELQLDDFERADF